MRISVKREIEDLFKANYPNCKIVRLSTYPKMWRHCCGASGVQLYTPMQYKHSSGDEVYYIHCVYCNQITYYVG